MAELTAELNKVILSCLIFVPIVGAILVALMPRRAALPTGIFVALANFVLSLHLVAHWGEVVSTQGFQFAETRPWMPQLGLNYNLGVDGMGLMLVLLTAFLTPIVLLAAPRLFRERGKELAICLLLLEGAAIGAFSALDVILFYIFFEATLPPIYILIAGWGGARRSYAALKFFLYTMAGSVLMWVSMLYLFFQQPEGARSFAYEAMKSAANAMETAGGNWPIVLFLGIAAAFAVKSPIFPLHTWQADAYAESPTPATIMLGAILSKLGVYGFLRFALPFFPQTAAQLAPYFIALSVVGIIYGALVAAAQTDFKKLLAYSSLSHVSLIILGAFAMMRADDNARDIAYHGVVIQMVNHGLTTAALFLIAGMLMARRGSRILGDYGGLASPMPRFAVLFWFALFASIGLPGLNGFVGEYLILQGAMQANFLYALGGATGVVLGAIYMLRAYRKLMYGEVTANHITWPDADKRETLAMALMIAAMLAIGVMPKPFLAYIGQSNIAAPTVSAHNAQGETFLAQKNQ